MQRLVQSCSFVAVVALASSCGLLRTASKAPGQLANAVSKKEESPTRLTPKVLRARLMRFSDVCVTELTRSTREFEEAAASEDAKEQGLSWRIEYSSSYWRLATGEQPYSAMLDTLLLTCALRSHHEHVELAKWGEPARPVYESFVRLEERAWDLAAQSLHEKALRNVKAVVDEWLAGDSESRAADLLRMPSFQVLISDKSADPGMFEQLFTIDPMSGLEPAVREMEQVRELSERALFYLERLPTLVGARAELLVDRSLRQPQVTDTLSSFDRVSQAAASFASTAEALPAQFKSEREAIAEELRAQREGLVADLEKVRDPMAALLDNTGETAVAIRDMSANLTDSIRAFDQLMERFERPAAAPEPPPAEPSTPKHPFDIREYTAAAEQIAAASRELGQTMASVDASAPRLQQLLDETAARGDQTIDHAFVRGLQLLAVALIGGALVALAVKRVSLRWRT